MLITKLMIRNYRWIYDDVTGNKSALHDVEDVVQNVDFDAIVAMLNKVGQTSFIVAKSLFSAIGYNQ